jgi:hypothetical protein
MLQSFNPKYMIFRRVRNIAFRRALITEEYQSAMIVGLLCWPLNRMPCLPESYYSAEILFRNWLCPTKFDWCESLDIGIHGNEMAAAFAGPEPCLPLAPSCVKRRSVSGYLNHTAPNGAWRLLVVSREYDLRSSIPGLTRYLLRLPRSK